MRYAVISTEDNSWQFESDDQCEAEKEFNALRELGARCVLVQVLLLSTDEEAA